MKQSLTYKNIFFTGIGGIGMSALAKYFRSEGYIVAGYDRTKTEITEELLGKFGINIFFDDEPDLIPNDFNTDDTLVIYTPAIPASSKINNFFQNNDYKLIKRSEALGLVTLNTETIAVAGSHGKTTISSILAHIFKSSSFKTAAFVGGISKNYNTNFISDDEPEIAIVEADEYDRSFLNLIPSCALISSIDSDHLDIYGDHNNVIESFRMFAKQIPAGGKLVINDEISELINIKEIDTIKYSINKKTDVYADNIRIVNGKYIFDLNYFDKKEIIEVGIPGLHNIENAVGAVAVSLMYNIDINVIKQALKSFTGIKRRFDVRINNDKIVFIDDYAHHPNELKALIESARHFYPGKKLTLVFQPHLYSRTNDHYKEFAKELDNADELILLDIYPAREIPINGVSSEMIHNRISVNNKYLLKKEELLGFIKEKANDLDVLITAGAGNIGEMVNDIEYILKK